MAVGWLASFKEVSWSKVSGVASSITESGRKIWDKLAQREAEIPTIQGAPKQPAPSSPEAIAAIEVRVAALEKRTAQLGDEAVASFDVVRSLADQHSELVGAVDVLLVRTRVLIGVCIVLGLAVVALLVLVLSK